MPSHSEDSASTSANTKAGVELWLVSGRLAGTLVGRLGVDAGAGDSRRSMRPARSASRRSRRVDRTGAALVTGPRPASARARSCARSSRRVLACESWCMWTLPQIKPPLDGSRPAKITELSRLSRIHNVRF
ncbi:hypothetical protein ACFPRL_03845 [Pseudoclavibacter helvolus]